MTVVVTTWSSMFRLANTIDGGAAVGALGAIVNGIEIVEDLLLAIVMTVTAIGASRHSMRAVDGHSAFFQNANKESTAMDRYRALADNETGEKILYVHIDSRMLFNSKHQHAWADKHGIALEVVV